MPIYDKPVRILMHQMADALDLQEGQSFTKEQAVHWFAIDYRKIKVSTIGAHLIRLSTNAPNRIHFKPKPGEDDLFFQIDASTFRLYDRGKDPPPIIAPLAIEPESAGQNGNPEIRFELPPAIANPQIVGNIGLFYVCYRLSRMGWNVMPTARNAKGVDILIYSQDARRKESVQVKTLSKASPVPLGKNLENHFADWFVICRHVMKREPECFILRTSEVRGLAHKSVKNEKVSYWLPPPAYAKLEYKENWGLIGLGLAGQS
jgi:hypothetical protein